MTTSPSPATATDFRPDVQGLRAIAVAIVVAYHAGFVLDGGFVGVDAFFVISGFVITRMLLREAGDTGRLDFRSFYLRRIRRILPALAVALSGTMLLGILLAPLGAQTTTARTGIAASLINANSYLTRAGGGGGYFGVDAAANPLLHTWSLAVEEQFYLVFPALLALAWFFARRRGVRPSVASTRLLIIVIAVSLGVCILLTGRHLDPWGYGRQIAFYAALPRAWEFAAGALLAGLPRRSLPTKASTATPLATLGLVLLVIACLTFSDATVFPGAAAILPVAAAMLLIAAGSAHDNPISRALGTRPMRYIGDISYSWYLWHWPCIVFAHAIAPHTGWVRPVAGIASTIPAAASYTFIENPIRHRKNVRPRRTVMLGLVCVVTPLLAAIGLFVGHNAIGRSTAVRAFDYHADMKRGCSQTTPLGMRTRGDCEWKISGATGTAVLIGDSNAGQFTEGFVEAARLSKMNAIVATKSSCPFANLRLWNWSKEDTTCSYFVSKSLAWLVKNKPDVVVIASSTDGYVRQPYFTFRNSTLSESYVTPEEKAGAISDRLAQVLNILRYAGIRAVVVHNVPKFDEWKPIAMPPIKMLGPASWINKTIPRDVALGNRQLALDAETTAVTNAKASAIDFFDTLCPSNPCTTHGPNGWIYRDNGHISVAASKRLAEGFAKALTPAD